MKSKFQIVFVMFVANIAFVSAQEYTYDVKVFGKKIGSVIAYRTQEGTKTIYKTTSLSTVNFFGKKEITTLMETVYQDDVLQSSFYEVKKNSKIKEKAVLEYVDDQYFITTNGKETNYDKPISMSTIMLTYHKPQNNQNIFEEVGGFYKKMVKINENEFELVSPKSRHRDTYIYSEDGILEKCIVRKTLFNFEMILSSDSKKKEISKL
ncbi:DUF6134 family protein [uncultured Tenacibaculum sp.]|uniref:DUF6134 family protein n=1 Tax=uncultured Tenacibaculum sp. TaxID=174713 RepID=UPI0026184592|nr:DUF6134 family protein [uncultured Tenacibaculum sp.]